ncbi:uncharacterized protein At4g38062 [Rhododendron vialii]|uniref:uncharacterized protein At4g38062 n=1 Tax=Rhododendron vialii TaxID=182163 RepID=UPI0026601603|nr:uncharacterized protein At4g38062 [Rhododendron vialii]XP_058184993.1 uncharacterized protein At4g38062 [Rhododendron vialii]
MERVCEELDDAKAEIEKLKAEFKTTAELCERLKRTHDEQQTKILEANAKIEKQSQELNEKADEISTTKQMYEELKSSMKEKEAMIKHLAASNDKLRVDFDEKLRKWDEEKREMVLAFDEANSNSSDHELKLHAYEEEIKGLKSFLSDSEKKRLEAEKKAEACRELRERDDMLFKQEEEKRKVEDQLKWKKEQFKHLEEAHEKLRCEFQQSKKEWEVEKSTLIDEISTLQTNLDSQTRISEGLQSRLQMCNQALAHEESRRKYLEVQLSETKTSFENVLSDCEEAKSKIECLTGQRDKDIASLRDMLGTKEMIHKEMTYQVGRLEQENRELKFSLKEMQEAQIQEGGSSSSLSKLRNKLKGLEQTHRDCSKNLKVKEAEWSSGLEKMEGDLTNCRFELESKDRTIKELNIELEGYRSLVMHFELQNEEKTLMLMVLKSEISEAQLKLADEMENINLKYSEREEEVSRLMRQLAVKNAALVKADQNIEEGHEKIGSLLSKVESLSLVQEQKLQLQDEVERQKGMVMNLEWLNEEKSLMLFVLKSEISEAQLKLADEMENMVLENVKRDEEVSILVKQLNMKSDALVKAETKIEECHEKIEECHEEIASLLRKVEFLSLMEQQHLQLQNELESLKEMQMHLGLQNEEKSLTLLVVKLGISEAQAKIANMALENSEKEDTISALLKQLEMKSAALVRAEEKIESLSSTAQKEDKISALLKQLEMKSAALVKAEETIESLLSTAESVSLKELNQIQLQNELEKHKEMLKDAYRCQTRLKEQVLQMERYLKKVDDELSEKFCDGNELEFGLQVWKSVAEGLQATLEENQQLRKQVEGSLLAQVGVEVTLKQEKESLGRVVEERERRIEELERDIMVLDRELKTRENVSGGIHKEIECLEQECVRRELEGVIFTHINMEFSYEHEKMSSQRLLEERDKKIDDLERLLLSMEERVKSSTTSFNLLHKAWEKITADGVLREIEIQEKLLVIAEMEHEKMSFQRLLEERDKKIDDLERLLLSMEERVKSSTTSFNLLHKAWEKITADGVLREIEIQEKLLVIAEMESDFVNLEKKLELLQESFSRSKKESEEFEAEMRANQSEIKKLTSDLRTSGAVIDKIESEKRTLLDFIGSLFDRISELSDEDMELTGVWERIVQNFENNKRVIDLKVDNDEDEIFDPSKENVTTHPCSTTKRVDATVNERSPFRALNS